jgi:hypothetical protein
MIGVLKRRWWLGPLVASFAIAASVIVQATITIANGIIHAANTKPLTSQEPRLNPLPSFQERWQSAFSINGNAPERQFRSTSKSQKGPQLF